MKLPPYIFIIGPQGAGCKTFAEQLYNQDRTRVVCSFNEPIHEATLAVFYPEHLMQDISLTDPAQLAALAPFTSQTIATWLDSLKKLIRSYSSTLLGDLLKKRLNLARGAFSSYLILDAEQTDDIRPFVNGYGAENCLIVLIERPGLPITDMTKVFHNTFLPTYIVRNPEGDPSAMLAAFEAKFGATV